MNNYVFFALIIISSFCLNSCATTGKMINLQLDMSKAQVINIMGEPTVMRGSMRNKYNQVIEVWEYEEYKSHTDAQYGWETTYWFYFYDNNLVQWGEAGDWRREADNIYEHRFR